MDIYNMKNIVVLKNLPSNMVEEAFVVLKSNVKIKQRVDKNNKKIDNTKITKDVVVKEAEMIVEEYIKKIEKQSQETGSSNKRLQKKYNRLKALTIFLVFFSLLASIVIILV